MPVPIRLIDWSWGRAPWASSCGHLTSCSKVHQISPTRAPASDLVFSPGEFVLRLRDNASDLAPFLAFAWPSKVDDSIAVASWPHGRDFGSQPARTRTRLELNERDDKINVRLSSAHSADQIQSGEREDTKSSRLHTARALADWRDPGDLMDFCLFCRWHAPLDHVHWQALERLRQTDRMQSD